MKSQVNLPGSWEIRRSKLEETLVLLMAESRGSVEVGSMVDAALVRVAVRSRSPLACESAYLAPDAVFKASPRMTTLEESCIFSTHLSHTSVSLYAKSNTSGAHPSGVKEGFFHISSPYLVPSLPSTSLIL